MSLTVLQASSPVPNFSASYFSLYLHPNPGDQTWSFVWLVFWPCHTALPPQPGKEPPVSSSVEVGNPNYGPQMWDYSPGQDKVKDVTQTILEKITSIKTLGTLALQRWFRFSDLQASKKNAGFLDSTNQPLMQIPGQMTPDLHLHLFIYTVEIIVLVYSNICYKTRKSR